MSDRKAKAPMNKKKVIVIACIGVIILLNILWTVLQSKFTPKLAEVQAGLARMEERFAQLEQSGLLDAANLQDKFGAMKEIGAKYEERMEQLVKAEEEQLARLEAQVEAQKARLESLKRQLSTPAAAN